MSGTVVSTTLTSGIFLSASSAGGLTVTNTGAVLLSGRAVYNGNDFGAGIYDQVAGGLILNLGTIESDVTSKYGVPIGIGIELAAGGTVINGSNAQRAAFIGDGVALSAYVGSSLLNYGTIAGGVDGHGVNGDKSLIMNGSPTDVTALISGASQGVLFFGDVYVENYGTVLAGNGSGLGDPYGGLTLVNGSSADTSALIEGNTGRYGVSLYGNSTLVNFGRIFEQTTSSFQFYYGLSIQSGGYAINHGTIVGKEGAFLGAFGTAISTLVNDGVIDGSSGTAVVTRYGTDVLVVDPGAVFEGAVDRAASARNVLELGAGVGSLLTGEIGPDFTNFDTIDFAAGAEWSINGDVAGLAEGQTIGGFGAGDTIILDGFDAVGGSYVSGVGLELSGSAGTGATLDILGSFGSGAFAIGHEAGNSVISLESNAPCFVAGTRILAVRGEIAVENLCVGDWLINRQGEEREIVWIGRRRMDLGRHPRPWQVRPVCIEADALGEGVPRRRLLVSPDHALLVEGCLVPAKALLNGVSVYQLAWGEVVYYHVELARHDIIFAEHVAVESYLETGNRWAFDNGGSAGAVALHPAFGQVRREAESCARFVESGPVVDRALERLGRRGVWRRRVSRA